MLARYILKLRYVSIAVSIVLVVFFGYHATKIDYDLSFKPLYIGNDPDVQATDDFIAEFDNSNNMIVASVSGDDVFTQELFGALRRITARLAKIRHVDVVYSLASVPYVEGDEEGLSVGPFLDSRSAEETLADFRARALGYNLYQNRFVSPDGTRTGIFVQLNDRFVSRSTERQRKPTLDAVERVFAEEVPPDYAYHLMGTRILERDYAEMLHRDEAIFFSLGLLINIVLLMWALRSWKVVLVALVLLPVCVVLSIGASRLMGFPIDILSTQMLPLIMVVGTAQFIHFVYAYYEKLIAGADRPSALTASIRKVGVSNLMASVTTAAGFLSLTAASVRAIQEFGVKMSVSIMITYLVVLILAPTLLMLIAPPSTGRLRAALQGRIVHHILQRAYVLATRRSRVLLASAGLILLGVIWGISQVEINNFAMGEVAEDHELNVAVRETDKLSGFSGFEVDIVSLGEALTSPSNLKNIELLQDYIKRQEGVITAWSIVDYLKEMNAANQDGIPEAYTIPSSGQLAAQYLLLYSLNEKADREVRGLLSPDRKRARLVGRVRDVGATRYLQLKDQVEQRGRSLFGNEYQVKVVGEPVLVFRGLNNIVHDLVSSFSVAFIIVFGVLFLFVRSWRLGLVSILPNLTPLIVTLGMMGLAGISLRVGTTIFFSIALAISVDDTIHYLARYRQELASGADHRTALLRAHFQTGRAIVATSFVVAAGFLVMVPSEFLSLRDMGILNSTAIMIALIGDITLLPLLLRSQLAGFEVRPRRAETETPAIPQGSSAELQ